ncbi:NnrS family protein [uncultured Psychrobacter sp.]|uniref:NnrS family protein n=1 Tax=uncultured Psychrobacter sp. TaxID=259303 RepID=UPI0030DB0FF0|tara:strand:- start:2865 stop:4097 length:1233 start_codon:yes stop_codon:yes gene_type:complete
MLQIQLPSDRPSSPHPILNLAFRLFFSAAGVFAVLTMLLWVFVFTGKTDIDVNAINPLYWHGHEMLYGYTIAVIAGFLLTAVKTWTGMMMPYGYRLLGIFLCWGFARIGWALVGMGVGSSNLWLALAAVGDLAFMVSMTWVITKAVLAVKQYKQMGIISKLGLLTVGNGLCYWGIYSGDMNYVRVGIYLGLYLIIALVLTIGRRVVPFFIERGISSANAEPVKVKNSKALDILSLVTFLIFMISDIFYPDKYLLSISALSVALVNGVRLLGWYHHGIWKKPLLWSLYLAFLGMCSSFILFALQPWFGFSHSIAVHALALSGVGMMTLSMMDRVSLGHTGRNIHQPSKAVPVMFILMIGVFVFRVIMPLIAMDYYLIWLVIAQTSWILCFALFCTTYIPILSKPRPDKLFG